MELQGKVALVLGAAKGIGKAIAIALARAGARVAVTCFDWPEESAAMKRELYSLGYGNLAIQADLRDPLQVRDLTERVMDRFGGLDILINNIERGGMPVVHGPYTPEQWDLEIETTLKAKWWVMHYSLPLLKAAPEGVAVILSSISGMVGRCGPASLLFNDGYAAANRAISSFTETWAREAGPTVRVNELMLGFFETRHAEHTRGWGLLSEAQRQAIIDHTLLRRTGRLEDIIKTVFFLVRDAPFMTGSIIRLDGGYVLGGEPTGILPPGVV